MDGTLVDSTDGVVGAWETFAEKYPGIDLSVILSCEYCLVSHGSSAPTTVFSPSHSRRTNGGELTHTLRCDGP